MAAKELLFNTDARAKLKRGVDALAEALNGTDPRADLLRRAAR